MRLVITMMTRNRLSLKEKVKIINSFSKFYKLPIEEYIFQFDGFHEFDVDIFDVVFTKDTLKKDLLDLTFICEEIIRCLNDKIDFIISNDDTMCFLDGYVLNRNDVSAVGLFVSKRDIPGLTPFYSSEFCNAYINLEYNSFGVYD
jgi:hypothetical protein